MSLISLGLAEPENTAEENGAANSPEVAEVAGGAAPEPQAATVAGSDGGPGPDLRHLPRERQSEIQRLLARKQSIRTLVGITEGKLARAKERETLQHGYVLQNVTDSIAQIAHLDSVRELQALEVQVQSYKGDEERVEAEIEKLRNPSVAEREAWAAQRRKLKEILLRGRELKRKVATQIEELKPILSEVNALTEQAEQVADEVGLRVQGGLDSGEYERLAEVLRKNFLEQSESFYAWILGEQNGRECFVVRVPCLVLPETLVHCGIYRFGESVSLSEKEAHDLLCDDWSAATHEAPWRCLPQRITTTEEFAHVQALGEEKGVSAQAICVSQDLARDTDNREFYFRNALTRRTLKRRVIAAGENIDFREDDALVEVKVCGNLDYNGKLYKPGEVVQIRVKDAWEAAVAGAMGAL